MVNKFYSFILRVRNRHLFALDFIVLLIIPLMSLFLRCETVEETFRFTGPLVVYTLTSLFLKMSVFYFSNFYRIYWPYASVDEIVMLYFSTLTSWAICIIAFFAVLKPTGMITPEFPRSVPFIDGILTILVIGGIRFALRMDIAPNERKKSNKSDRNVLIVGAGVAGSMIVKELRSNPHLNIKPVCFVDDDPLKQGVSIHGVKVTGTLKNIPELLKNQKIDEVIISMPTAPGKVIQEVVQWCKEANIVSKTIPGVYEILAGSVVAQIREVQIEDLLRRGVVCIDTRDVAKLIYGACVMVTGAGGSIGSELCRQIITFRPKELVLLGHGENSIFHIAAELKSQYGIINEPVTIHTVIADIRDKNRMSQVFELHKPKIVFHAAAHKHVGLMEKNLTDAVTNNVLGTQVLVDLADRHSVERFVLISSDKAVNPISIMGVTKRVAELVVQDAAVRTGKIFVTVRFANVLGSRGSVVPILREQIQRGGPVTITHPNVTRFFMTIPEAVQLVLQASKMGQGGELFVLDMGQSIKILDLAKDLLRLSGLREGIDIDIVFTGLQNGEKMHEELFYETEKPKRSSHEKILICSNGDSQITAVGENNKIGNNNGKKFFTIMHDINLLIEAAQSGNTDSVYYLIKKIVPQYRESECPAGNLNDPKTLEHIEILLHGTAAPTPTKTNDPK
ncbi:MAG: nucleoside-diphosphate sugar epimerase/dehydratase [Bacteroidota bacterium]|jgi:FlaA1/EpsC-like NDP-sugar epimerase